MNRHCIVNQNQQTNKIKQEQIQNIGHVWERIAMWLSVIDNIKKTLAYSTKPYACSSRYVIKGCHNLVKLSFVWRKASLIFSSFSVSLTPTFVGWWGSRFQLSRIIILAKRVTKAIQSDCALGRCSSSHWIPNMPVRGFGFIDLLTILDRALNI